MSKELVLARAGHYFNAGNGGCQAATVAHVENDRNGDPLWVNVQVLTQGAQPEARTSVPYMPAPTVDDGRNSFHLTRECPWER